MIQANGGQFFPLEQHTLWGVKFIMCVTPPTERGMGTFSQRHAHSLPLLLGLSWWLSWWQIPKTVVCFWTMLVYVALAQWMGAYKYSVPSTRVSTAGSQSWFAKQPWIGYLTNMSCSNKFIHANHTDERNCSFFIFLKLIWYSTWAPTHRVVKEEIKLNFGPIE